MPYTSEIDRNSAHQNGCSPEAMKMKNAMRERSDTRAQWMHLSLRCLPTAHRNSDACSEEAKSTATFSRFLSDNCFWCAKRYTRIENPVWVCVCTNTRILSSSLLAPKKFLLGTSPCGCAARNPMPSPALYLSQADNQRKCKNRNLAAAFHVATAET